MSGANGFERYLQYPLAEAIFKRRSRRISKGIGEIPAGSLTWRSNDKVHPLTELEQAVLIAATGITGITMPDMPGRTETGTPLLGSPMLEAVGRAASSPDNAQATAFVMIDDEGTYLLRKPEFALPPGTVPMADDVMRAARLAKVRILDKRLEFPRRFPCYVGRNRAVSNLPGTTVFVPIVDLTRQYINGMMYLLSQPDGQRPAFIDDWNFYRWAGCKRWIKNGFLNPYLKLPLGYLGTFRIHVEADFLVQNLLLTIHAMGLGGWVHAGFPGPLLLGDPGYRARYGPGLGFEYSKPRLNWRVALRPVTPLPAWSPNPVALGDHLRAYCPPNYPNMANAVDALLAEKYGPGGIYSTGNGFAPVFRRGLAETFVNEVAHFDPDVVACAKDICTYIYETYGRFPAHVDAFHVPGIWVQAHHLALDYYDSMYVRGYSETQAQHDALWHG
ncbi:hypothetical protein [Bradyrhizobium sp. 30]|uniref:hypothetical protein n=1 Tax=Bradyrhizobium sp. 30 TaxID=2782669 RepID=UPI001FF8113F|nr:hypothetical protein [Bradyrhizobium sp. 30]MCK1291285.1 hypothetical protein [Bradyrhizobium sp. 30]